MEYLTQDATVGKDVWRFYGVQPTAHDHDVSVEFSACITGVMKATYGDKANIELGHFASNQSSIPIKGNTKGVVELVYKSKAWSQKAAKKATKSSKKAAKRARA